MNNKKLMINKEKGITIVSLIVTIVVLIVVSTITINLIVGKDGMMERTMEAAEVQKIVEIKQEIQQAWGKIRVNAHIGNYSMEEKRNALETELRKVDRNATVVIEDNTFKIAYKNYSTTLDDVFKETEINEEEKLGDIIFSGRPYEDGRLRVTAKVNPESFEKLGITASQSTSEWTLVSSEEYGFDSSGSGYYTSNNQYQHSTTAETTWEITMTDTCPEYEINYGVSSESGCDGLTIILDDDTIVDFASGNYDTSTNVILSPGTHTITAIYHKDGSVNSGTDSAYLSLMPVDIQQLQGGYTVKVGLAADECNRLGSIGIQVGKERKVYGIMENSSGEVVSRADIQVCSVTYDPNGGTGEMPKTYFLKGQKPHLLDNKYYNNGLWWLGWSTTTDEFGTIFDNPNDVPVFNKSITLYVLWSPNGRGMPVNGNPYQGGMGPV